MMPNRRIPSYFEVGGATRSDVEGQLDARMARLEERLSGIRHVLAVMSGKGGVGKSIVTANLSAVLAAEGARVGVADADLNGPCMARLLGVDRNPPRVTEHGVEPGLGAAGVRVMSMDLLLADEASPLRWRGPDSGSWLWRGTLETNALREFLADTAWGALDYLILDLPPGADRVAPVRDLIPDPTGLIAVTLPSELSRSVVARSLTLARELELPVIGHVVNMVGYICPHCGERGRLFDATEPDLGTVPCLAEIPFDPNFGRESDAGRPYVLTRPDASASRAIRQLANSVRAYCEGERP